jgi:hypothetical protein
MRLDLLDPRAVLRPVKAWPANTGASGKLIATASLDGPCARRASARAGRDEGNGATNKEQHKQAELTMT